MEFLRRFLWFLVSGWFRPLKVGPLEGFFLRLLLAIIVIYSIRLGMDLPTEPAPKGLLKILIQPLGGSLTWLSNPEYFATYRWVMVGFLVLYVAGLGLPIVLPIIAVMHILPFTLYNSQSYTHHGYQILSLTLMMQAITAIYAAIRQPRGAFAPPGADLRRWLLIQSQVAITGCYFVSVVTKMDNSNFRWFANSNHVAMDMVKTQRQNYLNHFDEQFLKEETEAKWFLERPWLSRIMFSSGVILEAICIFAIGNRLLGLIFGISLILMHRSIDHLMSLTFIYNELLVAVFLVGLPFALAWLFERIRHPGARWGAVAGLLAGVPLSYLAQPETLRASANLAEYLVSLPNALNFWGSWDTERLANQLGTVALVSVGCAILGLVLGRLLCKGNGDGNSKGDDQGKAPHPA